MKRLPTLKQLQYLVALAETRHFGRAAERCFITQSTLSAGIRDLETVLEIEVAERTNRQVMLTRVGERIAERARVLLRDAEDVMDIARASRAPMSGEIRLGVIPTIGPFFLPKVMPPIRSNFQSLKLFLREDRTLQLLARLAEGELDLAVIALPFDTRDFCVEIIFEDELLFACARDHPLAGRSVVDLDTLDMDQLMLLEEGHCLRDQTLEFCHDRNLGNSSPFEATSLHTLVQMVAAGIGVALIPKLAVDAAITSGANVSLSRTKLPAFRRIGVAWRSTSSRTRDFQTLSQFFRKSFTRSN
ncbi:MAG: hydrogen peroxide-inducible genes activator [Gammaproteobacteria bacterium]|nr:hydrogen peroxide-inducible genes activator [Gammaproteobacteria bacterium]